jgi:PST family polysaccharide transporter
MNWREFIAEARPLFNLGIVFMLSEVMWTGTLYLQRAVILRHLGIDAVGIYQAAMVLSVVYVGFIVEAMGKDFYPSLTAIARDTTKCTSLINNQIEVGLLIAMPGILGTMTFASPVIGIFYSSKFMLAVKILRWEILGALLQVINWPIAFLIIAKGNGKLFFLTDLFGNCMFLLLLMLGIIRYGLPGAGMAYLANGLLYGAFISFLVWKKYHFKFDPKSLWLMLVSALAASTVFLMHYCSMSKAYYIITISILIVFTGYSAKSLIKIAGPEYLTRIIHKLL